MKTDDGQVTTADGVHLYWRAWLPPTSKGVLLFIHGLGEHSGRYATPAAYFVERGYACYAADHRSHGRSPGRRVDVAGFDQFLLDVAAIRALARDRHPVHELVLVGHSQGGLVALTYALEHPDQLAAVVVSSPLLGIHPSLRPGPLRFVAKLLSPIFPGILLPNGVDPRHVSRDPGVVDAYVRDPLVSRRASPRWLLALHGAMQRIHADAGRLRLPTLVLAAGDDRLVNVESTRAWAARAPQDLVELVVWESLYHELFNEPEKQEVFARLAAWLDRRRPG